MDTTYILIVVLGLWGSAMSWLLYTCNQQERDERIATGIRHMQQMAGLRSEVQALTEALVRAQGGQYIAPITRNKQSKETGEPTDKWFGKIGSGGVVLKVQDPK